MYTTTSAHLGCAISRWNHDLIFVPSLLKLNSAEQMKLQCMYVHSHFSPSRMCNISHWNHDLCALSAEAMVSKANEAAVYVCTQTFQPLLGVHAVNLWNRDPQTLGAEVKQSKTNCSVWMEPDQPLLGVQWAIETVICTPWLLKWAKQWKLQSTVETMIHTPSLLKWAKQDKLLCMHTATPAPVGCAMSRWNQDLYALAAGMSNAMEAAVYLCTQLPRHPLGVHWSQGVQWSISSLSGRVVSYLLLPQLPTGLLASELWTLCR